MLELGWLIYLIGGALIVAAILDLALSCSNIGTHLYVQASEINATDLARNVLEKFQEAVDRLLGEGLFTKRSVARVSVLSILINSAIVGAFIGYLLVFEPFAGSTPQAPSAAVSSTPVKPMTLAQVLLAVAACILPFLSFAFFDNLSVLVTRRLLARATAAKKMAPALAIDAILAVGLVWLQVIASIMCTIIAFNGLMMLGSFLSSDLAAPTEYIPVLDTLDLVFLGPATIFDGVRQQSFLPEVKIVLGLFLFGASNMILTVGYVIALLFSAVFHAFIRPFSGLLSKTLELIDRLPSHFLTKLTVVFGSIITYWQLP